MKQGFYNKNNTLKTRIITLITLAFLALAGGMDAVAQGTWTPPAAGGTFRLRSNGTGNNFDVYNAAGTSIVSSNRTKIYNRVILNGELTLIFENTKTIELDGQFDINDKVAKVTMKFGDGVPFNQIAHSPENPTLKITGNYGYNHQKVIFYLRNNSNTDITRQQVFIEGKDPTRQESYPTDYDFSNNFVIDGAGPTLTAVDDGTTMTPQVTATGGAIKDYALFRIQQGTLHLKNVTVQNFSTSYTNAGMAQLYLQNATATVDLEFNHCLFTNIGASSSNGSPVLRMQGVGGNNNNRDARLKYCKFENIFGSYSLAVGSTTAIDNPSATVRTVGNNQVKLSLDGCHFTHNYGCPVRWHGCSSAEPMRVNNCLIEDCFTWIENKQVFGGGGILLKGPAEIANCTIQNNRTNGKGGGIYLSTYVDFSTGTPGLIPQHSILTLDPATVISGNVALQDGGGVAIEAKLMVNNNGTTGTYLANTNGVIYWAVNSNGELEPFRTEFRQNGATIINNTAKGTYGGGVYISRHSSTPFYKVDCILNYGKIIGNKTGGNGQSGKGGGVAIKTYKDEEITFNYTDKDGNIQTFELPTSTAVPIVEPQDVTVVVSDPDLDPGNAADEMLVYDNHSGDGGGVYVEAYPNTYTTAQYSLSNGKVSEVNTTVYATGNITTNDAYDNGGGMYVAYGTVRINGGTIGGDTIAKGNNAGLDGGGIYLKDGNIYTDLVPHIETGGGEGSGRGAWQPLGSRSGSRAAVAGCNVLYNVAKRDGGGMFVNSGNVFLMASNVKDNTATDGNGGGIYTNGGNVFVNYWDADNPLTGHNYSVRGEITPSDISNNTAGLNGGGINTYSGFVRMRGENPTQEIVVLNNKAINGSGGGIFCMGAGSTTEEYVTIINAKLNENKATNGTGSYTSGSHTIHKGCGGAVYLQQGVIGVTKCQMIGNEANVNGGGINDHAGTINVKGCKIHDNEAKTGSGGGIYTVSGDVYVINHIDSTHTIYNSEITGNTANLNGGGLNTHHGYIRVFGNDNNRIPIANNLATTGSGGGVFCMGESASNQYITIQHADLINNKAVNGGGNAGTNVVAGSGGGIYLQTGKIAITKVNIQNNFAKNDGGGIYDHEGDIEVEECIIGSSPCESGDYYYKDDITYDPDSNNNDTDRGNLASTNGGGIYTQSGNVRITESSVQSNKANEHGGGIFLKFGTIFTHASNINFNIANINGGGIVNHEGKVYAYGCSIGGNTAKTGSGGGIYILKGDITTGPCIDPDVTTKSRATVIKDNKANLNGGGINLGDINDPEAQGNIFLNGDQVLDNVAETGNGGGIYISDGVIDLYGGKIERNFSNEGDGGGIWSGGGSFFINRRQGKPVVEVISIDSITNTTASIHYHVIDKGGTDTTNITGHGIICYGTSSPSTDTVPYNPASATHYSGHKNGCYYITISGLNAGTTYYVKAFATNTMHLEDFSDSVAFTTRNDKLVVQPKNNNEMTETQANFSDGSQGTSSMSTLPTPRPRDIYPAPAREPWDWDDYDEVVIASEAKQSSNTTEWIVTACGLAMTGNDIVAKNDIMNNVRALCDSDTIYPPIDVPLIQYNRAFEGSGGGIYMTNNSSTPTRLVFSGGEADSIKGKIIYNYAKDAGGGVYIDSNAYMQMKGYCEVNANWVPNGKHGGGIYLAGRLYVGENRDDVNKHALQVSRNFALNDYNGTAIDPTEDEPAGITALLNKGKLNYTEKLMRNNIMLPRNTYDFETTKDSGGDNQSTVITLLSDISAKDASGKTYTNMGFSVNNGFCPVVSTSKDFGEDFLNQNEIIDEWPFCKYYGTDSNPIAYDPVPPHYYEKWLHDLMPQGDALTLSDDGSIFEDTETYIAIHTDFNNQPFRVKYIYLWGSWTNPAVSIDPEINRPMYNGQGEGDPLWCGHYIIKNSENTVPTGVTGDTLTIPGGKQPEVLEWEIYSEEGLSWFSSYVNGLNAFTDGDTYTEGGTDTIHRKYDKKYNSYAKAKLMNDLDMSRHLWVPIGSVTKYAGGNVGESIAIGSDIYTDDDTHSYMGEFDGQGHIITGLHGQFLTGIKKYGLFGRLADTACVKNVFVDESKFITDKNDLVYHIGGIAGLMMDEAVIAGAEARTKIDSRYANPESYLGGLVGEVKGDGNKHAYIHSSMAMPEFYGGAKHVGGLVGKLGVGDTLVNSFSNPKFADSTYKDKNGSELYYYGGLVGVNDGLVENCYSRLQGREPIGDVNKTNIYGWLGGTNNTQANIKYCYAFADSIAAPHGSKYLRVGKEPVGHYSYGKTTRVNNKYGFDHRDQQIFKRDASEQLPKPGIVSDNRFIQNGILFGLLPTLDHWVDTFAVVGDRKKDYAHWERSLASPINDDYPLLMLQDFNTLGSKDCIYIHYGNDDKLLQDYNEIEDTDITYTPNVFIYDAAHISENNDPNVKVFIGEHVGITQAVGNNLSDVRVGVTFDNSSGNDLGHAYYDWHMFCTPLIEPPMGLIHHTGEYPNYPVLKNYDSGDLNLIAKGIPDDEAHYGARAFMDPPPTTWNTASGKIGYFPTDTPYGTNEGTRAGEKSLRDYTQGAFDFYMYGEYWHNHWINFKREGAYKNGSSFGLVSTVQDRDFFSDHWRQDAMKDASGNWVHYQIEYENEARMVPARGYMMAINEKWADLQYPDSIVRNPERHNMLMTDGNLRNHNEVYKTTFTIHDSPVQANDYDTEVRGTNLVGNPYQSYLDANKFLEANDAILSSKAYFVLDADHYGYIAYPKRASVNNLSAPDLIHPHQGFFVKVARTGDLVFTNDMRVAMKNIPKNEDTVYTFRERRLNYPLVNLICTDSDGMKDYTTVEINRPDPGEGAEKMRRLRTGNALIYARQDNKNFHVAFLPEGVSEVPVRFEPFADDEFRLTWNTLHGDFSYLHLIDNKTGVDVDCLNASEYRFTSKVGDYLSRFKLVFRCVGIDEDYEPDDPDGYNNQTTFAFQSSDEVIVNGSGHLDVFDVLGRCLLSTTLSGETNSVTLPRSSAGVYLLRLTDSKQTKVQKMVIH